MAERRKYRILMFAAGFAPYQFSENLVNSKLALAMQRHGWHVDILSARDEGPAYSSVWEEPWLALQPHTHEIRNHLGPTALLLRARLRASMAMGHPLPHVRWAYGALRQALLLHEEEPYDFVLSRSISCASHLPALAFQKVTGVPWLANWNDPPGFLFPPPYQIKTKPFWRMIWSRYYRAVAKRAALNTFPCQRLARYMQDNLGCFPGEKCRIIPHLTLDGHQANGQPDSGIFRLCHAGNLANERDPETLLAAMRRLIDHDADGAPIELELIGVDDGKLNRQVERYHLQKHVRYAGMMKYLDTLDRLACASVAVIVEAPCKEGIFLPSKLADAVQAGRPILAISPANGAVRDLLAEHGGGLAVDCTSTDAVYSGLKNMFIHWRQGTLDSLTSKSLSQYCASATVVSRYEDLFVDLLHG